MPTLQDLQAGTLPAVQTHSSNNFGDEIIVTDQRSGMSPSQCIEEKLLRLLQDGKSAYRSILPRRPR